MLFENIAQAYDLTDASIEIILMLLWAFILGMLLWWLLKPSKYVVQKVVSASAIAWVTSYSSVKKEGGDTNQTVSVVDTSEADTEIQDVKKVKKPKSEKDNLQMIEGVWPKIEKLMNKHGVRTFADIVDTDVSGLEDILLAGGPRYQVHSPTTWPDQARLAKEGKWWELEEYQWILSGGRKA